ncbi:MAG TPA: hypothetical protein VIL84_06285 [Devosiaceae bacterium]
MRSVNISRVLLTSVAVSMFAFGYAGPPGVPTAGLGVQPAMAQQGKGPGSGPKDGSGQGGQNQGGQNQGGQGQGGQGGSGGHETEADTGHADGGAHGGSENGGDHLSGKDLGRLNMARAFLAPGFDPAESDEPEAPMVQIAAYMDALAAGQYDDAVNALAAAASLPISAATVIKLDQILKVTLPAGWDPAALASAAEAIRLTLKDGHDHETH